MKNGIPIKMDSITTTERLRLGVSQITHLYPLAEFLIGGIMASADYMVGVLFKILRIVKS
jgi:hypothetical protein